MILALLVIVALLALLLCDWRNTLLVLMPVLLAGALTAASTVLLDAPFNFANIIAVPQLLGVGLDNGIHLVHRHRAAMAEQGGPLETSTARAVKCSALTTIFSFGDLAFSPHLGMASMGRMLTLGMVLMVISTLVVVLPALLPRRARR